MNQPKQPPTAVKPPRWRAIRPAVSRAAGWVLSKLWAAAVAVVAFIWWLIQGSWRFVAWLAVLVWQGIAWTFRTIWRYVVMGTVYLFVPPSYVHDSSYKGSEAWLRQFKPNPQTEGYDKALEYAWKKFDHASAASDTLDKKADNLMRNAGLVAGLLGLALNTLKLGEPHLLVPSLVAFTISLIFAALACNPTGGATSASVHDVLDDIGAGHSSDAWLAASIHCAIVGRSSLNNWKAKRIRWATAAFCIGLVLLLLPLWWPYVPNWPAN